VDDAHKVVGASLEDSATYSGNVARSDDNRVVITDARRSRSEDVEMRQRRYVWTMAIRTGCFVAMFFVPGLWKFAMIAGAAVLPGIAVVLANARENRTAPGDLVISDDEPLEALALTPGPVIPGEVVDGHG